MSEAYRCGIVLPDEVLPLQQYEGKLQLNGREQINDNIQPLHGYNAPMKRIKSRKSVIHSETPDTRRIKEWSNHLIMYPKSYYKFQSNH